MMAALIDSIGAPRLADQFDQKAELWPGLEA